MKCKHCGHEMPEGARFCAGCGNEMEVAPQQTATQQPQPEQSVVQVPQPQAQTADNTQANIPVAPPPLGPAENNTVFNSSTQVPPENGSFGYTPPVQQSAPPYAAPYTPPGQPMYMSNQMPEDKKSTGLNILSFFVPLVGIILWAVNKKDKPTQSKSVIHSAIAGMVTALVLTIVGVLVVVVGTFAVIGGVANSVPEVDPENANMIRYEETLPDETAGMIDWSSFEMSVGGKSVTLPCSYAEFTDATGFKADDTQKVETLEQDECIFIDLKDGQGNTMRVQLYNNTKQAKQTTDLALRVVGVRVDPSDCSKDVLSCFGISLGDTWNVQSFVDKCGEPSYEYDGNSGYATRQWSDANDAYNEFELTTYDGEVVEEIEVSCFGI